MKKQILTLCAWLLALTPCALAVEISVADHGVRPNGTSDATAGVRAALRALIDKTNNAPGAEGGTLAFEPGEYHFYPAHACALVRYISNHDNGRFPRLFTLDVRGAKNLTIDGRGARFVMHGDVTPFLIEDSANIRVQNLTIDWAVPLLYEGTVLASDKGGFEVRVRDDEPFEVDRGAFVLRPEGAHYVMDSFYEFEADGSGQSAGPGDIWGWTYNAKQTGEKSVRFDITNPGEMRYPPKPGNIIFLRDNLRAASAFFVQQSGGVELDNITVFHAPGMGLIAQRSENITMRRSRMIPNESLGRQVAVNFDATHFVGCRGSVIVEDCEFRNMLDDALNVQGVYLQVVRQIDARTIQARMAHYQSQGHVVVGAGDRLRLARPDTLMPVGEAVVERAVRREPDGWTITFSAPLPFEARTLDVLENLSWIADVVFQRNKVDGNRARGILISTSGAVRIEQNRFNATGAAIRISGDARSWFESGPVSDVLIKNNEIVNPMRCAYGYAAIDIAPEITTPDDAGYYHRNIRIIENRFRLCDGGVLFARSVDGLVFDNNTVVRASDFPSLKRQEDAIVAEHCRNIQVSANRFTGFEGGIARVTLDTLTAPTVRITENQGLELRPVKTRQRQGQR